MSDAVQKAHEYLCNKPIDSREYECGRDLLDRINELEAAARRVLDALANVVTFESPDLKHPHNVEVREAMRALRAKL